jgi:hypothetical protein
MYKISNQATGISKKMCLLLVIILIIFTDYAQTILIKGIATSAGNHAPLSRVTIIIEGTAIVATTDANRKYTTHATRGNTLIFTSLGYTLQKIVSDGQYTIYVALKVAKRILNQVVVMAYRSLTRQCNFKSDLSLPKIDNK